WMRSRRSSIATTDGSKRTTPSPRRKTTVFAVPRSTASWLFLRRKPRAVEAPRFDPSPCTVSAPYPDARRCAPPAGAHRRFRHSYGVYEVGLGKREDRLDLVCLLAAVRAVGSLLAVADVEVRVRVGSGAVLA